MEMSRSHKLETIWNVLHQHREELIPCYYHEDADMGAEVGHEEAYDEEWNEIVEAMDWIQEQVLKKTPILVRNPDIVTNGYDALRQALTEAYKKWEKLGEEDWWESIEVEGVVYDVNIYILNDPDAPPYIDVYECEEVGNSKPPVYTTNTHRVIFKTNSNWLGGK